MPSFKKLTQEVQDLRAENDELQDQLDAISDILEEGEEPEEEPEPGETD